MVIPMDEFLQAKRRVKGVAGRVERALVQRQATGHGHLGCNRLFDM